ncbi:MAG: hypothetical protein WEA58_04060 [Balneolaceae bacterium]
MKTILTLLLPLFLLFAIPYFMEADSFTETVQTTVHVDDISTVTAESTIPSLELDEFSHSDYTFIELESHFNHPTVDIGDDKHILQTDNDSQYRSLNNAENDLPGQITGSFAHEPMSQSLLEHTEPTNIGYRIKGVSTPYLFI